MAPGAMRISVADSRTAASMSESVTTLRCERSVTFISVQYPIYTTRSAPPPITMRRSRVKVSGVVTPSPVGVAMLWLE